MFSGRIFYICPVSYFLCHATLNLDENWDVIFQSGLQESTAVPHGTIFFTVFFYFLVLLLLLVGPADNLFWSCQAHHQLRPIIWKMAIKMVACVCYKAWSYFGLTMFRIFWCSFETDIGAVLSPLITEPVLARYTASTCWWLAGAAA